MLRKKCSYYTIGTNGQRINRFKGNDVVHIYYQNKDNHVYNNQYMQNLETPIILIEAENTGSANKMIEE